MIAELGHFCLIVALLVALAQAALPLVGAATGRTRWAALAYPAARAQCVLVALAFASLAWAFADNDFSVRYVAANSNTALPLAYRLAAVWGSHEGSMLLWTLMLGGWSCAVSCLSRQLPMPQVARVLGVMGAISAGFLAFLLFASNPFVRLLPPAMEGRDLNPLLQDPGMVFHPPLLYMGYVGFSVSFAFAVTALLGGRLDAAWARWSRPWTTAAWCFLTLGIMLGSAWAYYELGWGGWWFWDPVENASFMPWLCGTALIHSLAVTEKRGALRAWSTLLAILTFSLSLLGTFLVRSGVLTSVHAFAVDPARGAFILALLALFAGGALLLFGLRGAALSQGAAFGLVSRESFLLANNVLLTVAGATVLLGTLYPLLLDVFGLGKISVGPAYFEQVFVPLMVPAVLLMGAAPMARWRDSPLPEMGLRLRWAMLASLGVAIAALALLPHRSLATGLGLWLAAWCVASGVASLADRLRLARGRRVAALRQLPGAYVGMLVAHAGVGVFIAGVTLSLGQEQQRELPMRAGDTVALGDWQFRFEGVAPAQGPNYDALRARIEVWRGGRVAAELAPERRLYRSTQMPTTEAAIDSTLARDLYVALGESLDDRRWAVRLHVKPFIAWIWIGCLLMALGGAVAAADRRYRLARRTAAAPAPDAGAQVQA